MVAIKQSVQDIFPVGCTYVQYPDQAEPNEVFTGMTWTVVTSTYAGLFFRAEVGGSDKFGQIQQENIPQITKLFHGYIAGSYMDPNIMEKHEITLDQEQTKLMYIGWAMYGSKDIMGFEGFGVKKTFGEVRPKNSAIKIWKRIN